MRNLRAMAAFLTLGLAACVLPSYSVNESMGADGGATGGAGGSLPEIGGKLDNCGGSFLGGPTMVPVPGGYCIDSTEVTWDQYEAWYTGSPAPGFDTLPTECSWKTSYEPDASCTIPFTPANAQTFPVVCVDWCDAYAYCKAMGKRLCGRIGGGTNAPSDFTDPTKSQWENACTSGGRYTYPYGADYDGSKCYTPGAGSIVSVPAAATCQSPESDYAGVYDLSGNVAEWEDSCTAKKGESDYCRVRGGSFRDSAASTACDADLTTYRGTRQDWKGFRCCWEPGP